MPKYNTKESKDKIRNINYLNKDFSSIKSDLINYAKTYFPNTYSDFNETSPGMMMMEMSAYVGDVLSFYIDQQFKEMLLPTIEERRNLLLLSKSLGYKPKATVPAFARLKFKQTVPHDNASSDSNRTPEYSDLMTFSSGMKVTSTSNNDIVFETLEDLDFAVSGSVDLDLNPIGTDENGLTNLWEIERDIVAISGKTKTFDFTITSPIPFMKLTLPEKNVISIEKIQDSNGDMWYEVDYLAQDKVFKKTRRNDPYDSSETPVHYSLNQPESVDKRFTVEINSDNTTSLIFGNGLLRGKNDASYIENVFEENQNINALVHGNLPGELNPMANLYNNSLGESPSNTTLTVTYRVGGGLGSNVSSHDLETISNPSSVKIGGGNRLSTLTVTNLNPAVGGADKETIDEIKEKVKSSFSSQNRAVTREDYENRILSMPSEFGSIAKVFVSRKDVDETTLKIVELSSFDLDGNTTIGGETDAEAFDTIVANLLDGDSSTDATAISDIRQFIVDLGNMSQSDLFLFKNLEVYVLSYNQNKNLVKSSDIIKNNIKNYLSKFKILTDDVEIKNGHVINFGIKFRIESREHVNKSDLKVRCIDEIIKYFNISDMRFNQVIYTDELANILYNVDGVKVIHELKLTQDANDLNITNHLYATTGDGTGVDIDGQPADGVSGVGNNSYGFGYQSQFNSFYDNAYGTGTGVILPPSADSTPGAFELKNPMDNIKGVIE